jgi:hypothetical protein
MVGKQADAQIMAKGDPGHNQPDLAVPETSREAELIRILVSECGCHGQKSDLPEC